MSKSGNITTGLIFAGEQLRSETTPMKSKFKAAMKAAMEAS